MQAKHTQWLLDNVISETDGMGNPGDIYDAGDVTKLLESIDYSQVDFLIAENHRLHQELDEAKINYKNLYEFMTAIRNRINKMRT